MHNLPAFIVALLCTLAALWATAQPADAPPADGPAPANRLNFTPNPRYTVFDGPLREDGTIDYVAALNQRYREGVTKENNAFRGLFLVLPRDDWEPSLLRGMMQLLEVGPAEAAAIPQFKPWETYALELGLEEQEADELFDAFEADAFDQGGGELLRDWLVLNRPALDAAVQALERTHYWAPLVNADGVDGLLFYVLLPQLGNHRMLARAMWRDVSLSLSEGNSERALSLVRGLRMLGSHQSRESILISRLVAISIDSLTLDVLKMVIDSHQLNAEELSELYRLWSDRPEPLDIAGSILEGERCMALDFLMQMVAGRVDHEGVFGELGGDRLGRGVLTGNFDLNRGMARVSRHYVNMARVSNPDFYADFDRVREMYEQSSQAILQADMQRAFMRVGDAQVPRPLISKEVFTDGFTAAFLQIITPATVSCTTTEFRVRSREAVALAAIACEHYRVEHGKYPDQLDALVPAYLNAVPIDLMDGEPIRYRLDPDGAAVIYTIGTDLEDDGALDDEEDWKNGDYRMRLALPAE